MIFVKTLTLLENEEKLPGALGRNAGLAQAIHERTLTSNKFCASADVSPDHFKLGPDRAHQNDVADTAD